MEGGGERCVCDGVVCVVVLGCDWFVGGTVFFLFLEPFGRPRFFAREGIGIAPTGSGNDLVLRGALSKSSSSWRRRSSASSVSKSDVSTRSDSSADSTDDSSDEFQSISCRFGGGCFFRLPLPCPPI